MLWFERANEIQNTNKCAIFFFEIFIFIMYDFQLFDRFDRHEIDAAIIESAAKREEPYRIVVLGPEKVGKTALICRFLEKDFPLKHRATSEQTNFGTYTLAGVKVKLEILDTSGKNEVSTELIRIIDLLLSYLVDICTYRLLYMPCICLVCTQVLRCLCD